MVIQKPLVKTFGMANRVLIKIMKAISFLIATVMCGFVIFLTELTKQPIKYDCRLATYPTAIDVPQEVIKQCRKKND